MLAPPLELTLPFGAPLHEVHCPACGARVLDTEAGAGCPHTLYVFLGDISEPLFVHPTLEPLLDEEGERADDDEECPPGFLEHVARVLGERPTSSALRLSITTGGMACGPV